VAVTGAVSSLNEAFKVLDVRFFMRITELVREGRLGQRDSRGKNGPTGLSVADLCPGKGLTL
jgi:hypothetical protein